MSAGAFTKEGSNNNETHWLPENIIEIEKTTLRNLVERICLSGQCRYPLLAVRILIQAITRIEDDNKVYLSARQLSKSLNVHYDTVTKCLKYLREIEVLKIDKD